MNDRGEGILGRWDATSGEIGQAMQHAVADALREHKRAGRSVVMWDREKRKVVEVPPEEIIVPDEAEVESHVGGDA